jgi:hypothetical protein
VEVPRPIAMGRIGPARGEHGTAAMLSIGRETPPGSHEVTSIQDAGEANLKRLLAALQPSDLHYLRRLPLLVPRIMVSEGGHARV